jgi:hypothetical protein
MITQNSKRHSHSRLLRAPAHQNVNDCVGAAARVPRAPEGGSGLAPCHGRALTLSMGLAVPLSPDCICSKVGTTFVINGAYMRYRETFLEDGIVHEIPYMRYRETFLEDGMVSIVT